MENWKNHGKRGYTHTKVHLSKLPDEVGAKSPSLYIIGSLHGSTISLHPFMSLPAKTGSGKYNMATVNMEVVNHF